MKIFSDRSAEVMRCYNSSDNPEVKIPYFGYKVNLIDIHTPKPFSTYQRNLDDVLKKMKRDSEPPINLSQYVTKIPEIFDCNTVALSVMNSKREYNESNNMDETALINLGFTQDEITDLFGKSHTLNNMGIGDKLKQNLDVSNTINRLKPTLSIKSKLIILLVLVIALILMIMIVILIIVILMVMMHIRMMIIMTRLK